MLGAGLGVSHQARATAGIQEYPTPRLSPGPLPRSPPAPLTQQPLVALCLSFQEPVDALHGPQLDLHVRQVPHHPVEVVGDLWGVSRSQSVATWSIPGHQDALLVAEEGLPSPPQYLLLPTGWLFRWPFPETQEFLTHHPSGAWALLPAWSLWHQTQSRLGKTRGCLMWERCPGIPCMWFLIPPLT